MLVVGKINNKSIMLSERQLEQAPYKVDRITFIKFFTLLQKNKWLEEHNNALFDLWDMTEGNTDEQNLIENLLHKFEHLSSVEINKGCINIAETIENTWALKSQNTLIIATCGDDKPDGSQMLLQQLKNKFKSDWLQRSFFNKITTGVHSIKSNYNIVLIDDFIGTGDTIKQKIEYVKDHLKAKVLKNCKVYVVSLGCMEFATPEIQPLVDDFYSAYKFKKGISDNFKDIELLNAISSMESLENKLAPFDGKKKLPNFGYKRSEGLFAFDSYNIPNNVFPIFWWKKYKDGNMRTSIFNRI